MFRRKFIKAASGTALAGLVAGCPGNGGGNGGNGGNGGTPTPTPAGTGTAGTGTAGTGTAQTGTAETPMETTAGGGGLNWRKTIGNTPQGISVTNLKVQRIDNVDDDAGARLTGVIKNTGSQSYQELEVQATLFDQSDDVLGAYFDNTEEEEMENLAPGKQWQFSIDFPQADIGQVARYRVDVDGDIDESVWNWEETTTSA